MSSPADRKLTPTQQAWLELLATQDSTRRIARGRTGATAVTKQLCIEAGLVESGTRLMVDVSFEGRVYLGRPTYQLSAAGRARFGLPVSVAADEEREAILVKVWEDHRELCSRTATRLSTFTPMAQPGHFFGHYPSAAAWSEELTALALEAEALERLYDRLHRAALAVPPFQQAWGEATAQAATIEADRKRVADQLKAERAAMSAHEATHAIVYDDAKEGHFCTRCGLAVRDAREADCTVVEARD